jgi:hypothetical protein
MAWANDRNRPYEVCRATAANLVLARKPPLKISVRYCKY